MLIHCSHVYNNSNNKHEQQLNIRNKIIHNEQFCQLSANNLGRKAIWLCETFNRLGVSVVYWLGRRIRDREIASSTPDRYITG